MTSQEPLWRAVQSGDLGQAASALEALVAARVAPTSQQARLLLGLVQQPAAAGHAALLPSLALLARWARREALQPAAARDAALVRDVAAAASQLLPPGSGQPRQAAACLLLLGSLAAAASELHQVDELAEAVGGALLGPKLGPPEPQTAAEAAAAVGTLLPCLLGKPVAACWLLAALLRWLGSAPLPAAATCLVLDSLAPAYGMLRGAATTALRHAAPPAAVAGLLRPAYSLLRGAAAVGAGSAEQPAEELAQVAAAVLALGGLAEALQRSAAGFLEAAQLAADAEAGLLATCQTVEAAATAAAEHAAGLALLRDACSLAGVQLYAAVRRLGQAPSPSLAMCQAQSLLQSALDLGPLLYAAKAGTSPAHASEQLRRQVSSALGQHTAGLASGLAAQLPLLGSDAQRRLLQQVVAAGRQAHQQYRELALAAPPDWLAGLDAAAVRPLLDRLFLACLALLAAAWDAAPAPTAAGAAAGERAQLAASVAGVLADLQFCRLGAAQYATLLRAVLPEAASDPAAAASLAACLPCYADLAAPCPARGGAPAWLVDGVSAAKVQFLFAALVPCCALLPQAALEGRLAPLALLYLLHPHAPAAAAAHQLCCALLVAAPEEQREPLAAFYVRRCLEGCPGTVQLPQFGQGLATVLQALPPGSPVAVLCLQQVLATCEELAARDDPAADDVASLAAQQLLHIDFSLLDAAMAAFDQHLRPGGAAAQWPGAAALAALLRSAAVAAVRQTDDCVRKPLLARWLLEANG